jgi:transcriptional regulator with PAS, ATPase and Fis domain
VQKTDVRVVAASNVNFDEAVRNGKFREDLYYRLNTVPIYMPPLRERREDIHLLFRKFTTDFSEQYRMPPLELSDEAVEMLENYHWPGNIRQLKNITEQMSVIEQDRKIDALTLFNYLPDSQRDNKPMVLGDGKQSSEDYSEREILYKVLFDMKSDLTDLKQLVLQMIKSDGHLDNTKGNAELVRKVFDDVGESAVSSYLLPAGSQTASHHEHEQAQEVEEVEETLSLQETEKELIRKALKKHANKRKLAAKELGISERTLYRKIKEYDLK